MAQKRFGPTLDAGTVIIEKESEKTITASQLGTTGYAGLLDRGEVGKLITTVSKRALLKKTGGFIPDSVLPDNARDFWDHSDGAGTLLLVRITDGNEKVATLDVYDRKTVRNKVIRVDAKNGGSWGSKRVCHVADLAAVPGDITAETTVDLPILFNPIFKDEFKGGTITFTETGITYEIIANDKSDGAAKTTFTVAADSKMVTDFGAGTDPEVTIRNKALDTFGEVQHLAVLFVDSAIAPSTKWGVEIWLNDELVFEEAELSSDPNDVDYFVQKVNNNGNNEYVKLTDLWVGAITADVRPANHFGTVTSATEITAKLLKIGTQVVLVDSSLAVDNTITAFTFGADVIPDTYEVEVTGTGPPTWSLKSLDKQKTHTFPAPTDGAATAADNAKSIGFTVTGVTEVVGEKFTLTVLPLFEDEAIDGKIFFPDESGAPAAGFDITDNTETQATIVTGDLTLAGGIGATPKYRLQFRQQLQDGYDGIAEVDVNDFLTAWDIPTSEFNKTSDQKLGLIKFATPGVTKVLSSGDATTVEKAGIAYGNSKNHMYRSEIPASITDESAAKSHINDTLGRNTHQSVILPSFANVSDPVLSGRRKQIPITGMVHGREAREARNFDGYHKAAAGIEATLPRIIELPTKDTVLNGEILNPTGIQVVRVKSGNFVIWGDRNPATDPAFNFKHQRELLSHYEHVLQESFDFVIFAINDPIEQPGLIAALQSFFLPEFRKRAVRGTDFEDAVKIKIDGENNTDATRSMGDLNAEITLRLADTVERFIITVSKQGVFEDITV